VERILNRYLIQTERRVRPIASTSAIGVVLPAVAMLEVKKGVDHTLVFTNQIFKSLLAAILALRYPKPVIRGDDYGIFDNFDN
jgi:hypothetical protein